MTYGLIVVFYCFSCLTALNWVRLMVRWVLQSEKYGTVTQKVLKADTDSENYFVLDP